MSGEDAKLDIEIVIPKRPAHRPTEAQNLEYEKRLQAFVDGLVAIQAVAQDKASARGWCYVLEEYGLRKGDFDAAEELINDCRKAGLLPLGFTADESRRSFSSGEDDPDDITDPAGKARDVLDILPQLIDIWKPLSFHEGQDYYVQMLVEKIDLKTLFLPVCEAYFVPVASTAGWSSVGQREELIMRFKAHEAAGRQCVLLYCGDHDPSGLHISEFLRENLNALHQATGWWADNLTIDRFGLNYDFIMEQGLTWIENLETGSKKRKGEPASLDDPRHRDYGQAYVQDYLSKYGARKVEGNALIKRRRAAHDLCEVAINKYIGVASVKSYHEKTSRLRAKLRREVKRLVDGGYVTNLFKKG